MKRWLMGMVVVLALAVGGAWAYWGMAATEPSAVPNTVAASRGTVEETVLASGVLQASALVSVGAQVSGIVKTVALTLGQEVAAGDLVAEIDSLAQENAVKSAEASLANIVAQKAAQQANLAQVERSLTRAREMNAQKLVSQADLESAEAALASANAQLASLEAQIDQATLNVESARLNLARTRIEAPISGTVVAVLVEAGQTLSANQAAPTIVKIANLDSMLIKAEISEADVTRVAPGQKVYFTILGEPGRRIEARLRSVDPAPASIASEGGTDASSGAVYYNGIFEVPNPERRLRIAMTAQVTIVLDAAENAVLVPSASVQRGGRGAVVRVYDPQSGSITPRQVTVGLDNKVMAQIVDGLADGELVVSTAARRPQSGGAATGQRPGAGPLGGGGPPLRF